MIDGIKTIRQGGSLPFVFDRGGGSISGWTCTIEVKRFKGDTPIFTRALTAGDDKWESFLTQSETAGLAIGLHYLIGKLVNATTDEEEQIAMRFHVSEAWS